MFFFEDADEVLQSLEKYISSKEGGIIFESKMKGIKRRKLNFKVFLC